MGGPILTFRNFLNLLTLLVSAAVLPVVSSGDPLPLAVVPASLDLGTVDEGAAPVATFTLRNPLDVPLTVRQVVAGCGCVNVSTLPLEVPAKGEAQLLVRVTTEGFRGLNERMLRLFSSHPSQPFVAVPIKINVRSLADIQPEIISKSGLLVTESKNFREEITVHGAKLKAVVARLGGDLLAVDEVKEPASPFDVDKEVSRRFVIRTRSELPLGEHRERLFLQITDSEGAQHLSIVPIYLEVVSPVVLSRGRVNFGEASVDQKVRVTVRGDKPIALSGASSSSPLVSVITEEVEAGRIYDLKIRLNRKDMTEPLRTQITLSGAVDPKLLPSLAVAATRSVQ